MIKHNYAPCILLCLLAATMIFTLAACGKTDDTRGTQSEEQDENARPELTSQAGNRGLWFYYE